MWPQTGYNYLYPLPSQINLYINLIFFVVYIKNLLKNINFTVFLLFTVHFTTDNDPNENSPNRRLLLQGGHHDSMCQAWLAGLW